MDADPGPSACSSLAFKHAGREFEVATSPSMTLAALKAAIEAITFVPPARQKILGLKRGGDGKPPSDGDTLADLAPPKPGTRFLVLGAPGADPGAALAAAAAEAAAAPPLEDDWASDDSGPGRRAAEEEVPVPDRPENQEKLSRRIAAFNPVIRAPPRPGKRLLVCDIGEWSGERERERERERRESGCAWGFLTSPTLSPFQPTLSSFSRQTTACSTWAAARPRPPSPAPSWPASSGRSTRTT